MISREGSHRTFGNRRPASFLNHHEMVERFPSSRPDAANRYAAPQVEAMTAPCRWASLINGFECSLSSSKRRSVSEISERNPARRISTSIFFEGRILAGKEMPDLETAGGCLATNSNEKSAEPWTSFTACNVSTTVDAIAE